MEMNFCRRCGAKLTNVENHVYQCKNDHVLYANASPSVGVFIIDDNKRVTLSVRGIEPHKGMLDAFGGFLDGAELVEDALKRELKEELGLDEGDYTSPVFLCSGLGEYPHANETLSILSLLYYIQLKPGVTLHPQDDVADIATFALHEVPTERLHAADIVRGIKALQRHFS